MNGFATIDYFLRNMAMKQSKGASREEFSDLSSNTDKMDVVWFTQHEKCLWHEKSNFYEYRHKIVLFLGFEI